MPRQVGHAGCARLVKRTGREEGPPALADHLPVGGVQRLSRSGRRSKPIASYSSMVSMVARGTVNPFVLVRVQVLEPFSALLPHRSGAGSRFGSSPAGRGSPLLRVYRPQNLWRFESACFRLLTSVLPPQALFLGYVPVPNTMSAQLTRTGRRIPSPCLLSRLASATRLT